jgi:hypothetical protein
LMNAKHLFGAYRGVGSGRNLNSSFARCAGRNITL